MPTKEELIDALRRIEHAPNQGDRGLSGQVADAAYKAHSFLQGGDPNNPNVVGNMASHIIGIPSVAATADNISRGLPVDGWEAAGAAMAPLGVYQLGGLGVKGARSLANALRK
jgi:hypothetical protein